MAHAISLTNGTTTISLYTLTGDGIFVTGWDLATAGTGKDTESEIAEGLDVLIQAGTAAALQTLVETVEGLLWAADWRRRTQMGPRVFLQVQWDGEPSAWRSEVLGGKLEVAGTPDQWGRRKLEGTLALTRAAFWEGPETQIPLSNGNGSNNTAGLTVWNHDDATAGHDNWAHIAAGAVTGVLPAPLKLELKNTSGAAADYTNLYLANNVYSDPANFVHILEGESRASGGTVTADATSSGGSFNSLYFSAGPYGEMRWALTAAQMQRTRGRWVRLLARFTYLSGAAMVQPLVMDSSGKVLWRGATYQQVALPSYPLVDLGAVPLPPGGYSAGWDGITLALRFSTTAGPGRSLANLDFLQLTPTDSQRTIRLLDSDVANNEALVDDGIEGITYVSRSGGFAPLAAPRGGPLLVFPGPEQRIYVLQDEDFVEANIDRTFAVRAWYRPRRLTI